MRLAFGSPRQQSPSPSRRRQAPLAGRAGSAGGWPPPAAATLATPARWPSTRSATSAVVIERRTYPSALATPAPVHRHLLRVHDGTAAPSVMVGGRGHGATLSSSDATPPAWQLASLTIPRAARSGRRLRRRAVRAGRPRDRRRRGRRHPTVAPRLTERQACAADRLGAPGGRQGRRERAPERRPLRPTRPSTSSLSCATAWRGPRDVQRADHLHGLRPHAARVERRRSGAPDVAVPLRRARGWVRAGLGRPT